MKKNTISKMLLASLLVGGISLTSCGGPSTSFSGSYDEDDLSGSITVWWPGGSTALESVINDAVDRYDFGVSNYFPANYYCAVVVIKTN